MYKAAADGGYVDPHKIQDILGVPNTNCAADDETLSEAEFLSIAEALKPFTEERMKIEPFPWLKDYFIDMDELYTELSLEKINDTMLGETVKTLKNYEDLFDDNSEPNLQDKTVKQNKRKKVLSKANPGMGKTTLGKKMGLDWARGLFEMFSIIFFVVLRIVKPSDCIEEVIIQQNPELEGLNVSNEKVRAMLEQFGDRCLLIFDGLDEHGLGQNEDVLKIIRNQKLINCGISVTSRPHNTREIQSCFPTVVRVDGFTKEKAEKYVSKFFTEKDQITQILEFKPSDSRENFPVHKCPILLSFLCLLIKEGKIDLSDTKVTIGDLYLRMVQCLYKKFTVRKSLQFLDSNFLKVVTSVGQLALQTLISDNPLLQRSKVIAIVGDFAFEYGFFAGHEDFRLCTDPTAEICVTYLHRSLEEFFGSFGFLQALDDGKSIDDIFGSDCKHPIFMVNPLVLKFCLWLLNQEHLVREVLRFPRSIYNTLVLYVAKKIDCCTLDPALTEVIFPALSIRTALIEKDTLKLKFLKQVFKQCSLIRILQIRNPAGMHHSLSFFTGPVLNYNDEVDGTLELLNPSLLAKLTILSVSEYLPLDINPHVFTISAQYYDSDNPRYLPVLLRNHDLLKRNTRVYIKCVYAESKVNLISLITPYITQLNLIGDFDGSSRTRVLSASGDFPFCPQFTHFTARNFEIDDSVPAAFVKAVKDGKFPNLKRIELNECVLNDCEWPEVPEFSLEIGAKIDKETLSWTMSDTSQKEKIISQLSELTLFCCHDINHVISKSLERLAVLKLKRLNADNLRQLENIMSQRKLPNLVELSVSKHGYSPTELMHQLQLFQPSILTQTGQLEKLSFQDMFILPFQLQALFEQVNFAQLRELNLHNVSGLPAEWAMLFAHSFPRMTTLILSSCGPISDVLYSLSQAELDGKLPELEHLDISENAGVEITDLFIYPTGWNQLKYLATSDLNVLNIDSRAFNSLKMLHLTGEPIKDDIKFTCTRCWHNLHEIKVNGNATPVLPSVIDGVKQELFPALRVVMCDHDVPLFLRYALYKIFLVNPQ